MVVLVGMRMIIVLVGMRVIIVLVGMRMVIVLVGMSMVIVLVGMGMVIVLVGMSVVIVLIGMSVVVVLIGMSVVVVLIGMSVVVVLIGMSVVIVLVGMSMVIMLVGMGVVMWLETSPFAKREDLQPLSIEQPNDGGVFSDCFDRLLQKRLQIPPNPEHKIRFLKRCRLRRLEAVRMRGATTLNNQLRLANTGHNAADQRMDRLDRDDDVRGGDRGCGSSKKGDQRHGKNAFHRGIPSVTL